MPPKARPTKSSSTNRNSSNKSTSNQGGRGGHGGCGGRAAHTERQESVNQDEVTMSTAELQSMRTELERFRQADIQRKKGKSSLKKIPYKTHCL